jgi:hypothetical protein
VDSTRVAACRCMLQNLAGAETGRWQRYVAAQLLTLSISESAEKSRSFEKLSSSFAIDNASSFVPLGLQILV